MTRHLNSIHNKLGESQGVSSVKPAGAGQSSIHTILRKPMANEKHTRITRKAVMISVKDLEPLNLVKREGFREFCKALNPDYDVGNYFKLTKSFIIIR